MNETDRNCVLRPDEMCGDCGECQDDICDIDETKRCDNCCKCLGSEADFLSIGVDSIELPKDEKES